VDHFAVARADAGAEGALRLRGSITSRPWAASAARHGEADDAGADHGAIDFFHEVVAEFAQGLCRQG
jgi:hypothetical protein